MGFASFHTGNCGQGKVNIEIHLTELFDFSKVQRKSRREPPATTHSSIVNGVSNITPAVVKKLTRGATIAPVLYKNLYL